MEKYTKQQLLEAYCELRGYPVQTPVMLKGEPVLNESGLPVLENNPETKLQFLKRTERQMSIDSAISYLEHKAKQEFLESIASKKEGVSLD